MKPVLFTACSGATLSGHVWATRTGPDRWRHDAPEAAVDPDGDGNMFSFDHRSRLDVTRADRTKVDCEDLRSGCGALTADDGYAGGYAYAGSDRSPDR